jgi:hypothetical protein
MRAGWLLLALWFLGQGALFGHHLAHSSLFSRRSISASPSGPAQAGHPSACDDGRDCDFCRLLSQLSSSPAIGTCIQVGLVGLRAPLVTVRFQRPSHPLLPTPQGRAPPSTVA